MPEQMHREFMLAEMKWLAADFKKEIKMKRVIAKKKARKIISYHKRKKRELLQKSRKRLLEDRRVAKQHCRLVQGFWKKIDKIVFYKYRRQIEIAKAKLMEKHLDILVENTERLTKLLASNMIETREAELLSAEENDDPLITLVSEDDEDTDDEDYVAEKNFVKDDERTLIAAEREESLVEIESEISALHEEAEMDIEELRQRYMNGEVKRSAFEIHLEENKRNGELKEFEVISKPNFQVRDSDGKSWKHVILYRRRGSPFNVVISYREGSFEGLKGGYKFVGDVLKDADGEIIETRSGFLIEDEEKMEEDEEEEDEAFMFEEQADDETTLAEADALESSHDIQSEIQKLKEEQEMSVEELRRKYEGMRDENEEDEEEDEAFVFEDQADDETTMAAAEADETSEDINNEIQKLKEEQEMSVEELRRKYGGMQEEDDYNEKNEEEAFVFEKQVDDGNSKEEEEDDDDDDDDDDKAFVFEEQPDDETTMAEAEAEQTPEDINNEIQKLKEEAVLSVEELRRRYGGKDKEDNENKEFNIDVPFLMSSSLTLRSYQRAGLDWLVSLHDRRLNGILADEMGLGKTVQTISLLAHLAAERGSWGPHLIIVPTSVIMNWEHECKRWCPALKVMSYYGSAKQRKEKRQGWSKAHSFHICITSYQLVVQDANVFRRKRWYYMILDEAHNIKNFQSQRWQTLLHFNTKRRLLLTGTPLQNNLLELWSLLHFLMPFIFRSRDEFKHWFANPLMNMVEGKQGVNRGMVGRLHGVIRPFLLRRLKKDVEKQMPKKYEHVIKCHLSRRQKYLYGVSFFLSFHLFTHIRPTHSPSHTHTHTDTKTLLVDQVQEQLCREEES